MHLFPHWNWKYGQAVDVWVYTNCDEVELFLNGKSLGTKRKGIDTFHVMWRMKFAPGVIKAIGKKVEKKFLRRK